MLKVKDVDTYISRCPTEIQYKLKEIRKTIKKIAPTAAESISYRMPYYAYKGRLVYFALFKNHIGLYIPPPVIEEHKKELQNYTTTKSAVHFPLDEQLPISLIKKLIKARMKVNEAKK